MKILAIRGCNLASLAGEFEIDLAHGPLGGAGVFAIVGPTGAGKSTLLDAMCVALFDRTPRLGNHSRVVVGRGDDDPAALGAQDVRAILRRGASAGYAEVDFESGDARRYRARWSVRRARGAADGRFQDQQVSLVSLDGGERFGGTRTETLRAIHERLGLTFDQFRRSALLAQGEFAAFLRADGKDRSELLERMTGTEIYSRLSVAAHLRAQLAVQRLRDLGGAAAAIAVLADDARAAAAREADGARGEREAGRARLAAAEVAARWVAEAERRAREHAEAVAARVRADDAIAAAGGAREELAVRRRAEALRAPWHDEARLAGQLAVARGERAAADEAVAVARAARGELEERRRRLAAQHAPLRAARIAAGIVERAAPARGADHAAAAGDAAWLAAHRELGCEVAGWRALDARLGELAGLGGELAAADAALAEHARGCGELDARRVRAIEERAVAERRLAEARRAAATFERPGETLEAAGKRERAARLVQVEADQLLAIVAEARAAAAARGGLAHQLAELDTARDVDAELRAIGDGERAGAELLRREREGALAALRRVAGYAHARAELVDGEPCPLCGALEHPWRERAEIDAVIAGAEAQLAAAIAQRERAGTLLAEIAARDRQREREHARLLAQLGAADASLAAAGSRWRAHLAELGELPLVADPDRPAAEQLARERVAAAATRVEAAIVARSEADARATASRDAQQQVLARQAELAERGDELRELEAAIARVAGAIERLEGERAVKRARHAELAAAVAEVLARWRTALAGDPRAAALAGPEPRPALAALAAEWDERGGRLADAEAALAAERADHAARAIVVERALAEHEARLAEAARACERLADAHARAAAHLDAARAAAGFAPAVLHALLAGEPGRVEQLAEQLAELDRAADRARTLAGERCRLVADHAATRPDALADAARVPELAAAAAVAEQRAAELAAALAADDDARARRDDALARLAEAERGAEIDRVLGEVIGSHDGKLFRSFAQSLTLDSLLAVANAHLDELAPRYQLERVPKHDLELQVIDRDLGDDVRSVQSLSGGESFLVSLALALGLSSMSAHDVRVRTLLIDEGFGTLDPATLDSALAVLEALQATGRQVGVISHVAAFVERVGAHVRVAPRGGGRSDVVIAEA